MSDPVKQLEVLKKATAILTVGNIRLVKKAVKQATATAMYLAAKGSKEEARKVSTWRLDLQRASGILLESLPKAAGAREPGTGRGTTRSHDTTASLAEQGIDKHDASEWQRLASIPEPEYDKYKSGTKEITTAGALRIAKRREKKKRKKARHAVPGIEAVEKHTDDCVAFLKQDTREYDLICVDPPYNMGQFDWDKFEDEAGYLAWCKEWIDLSWARLKDGGSFYVFGRFRMLRGISLAMESAGFIFRDYIVWNHLQGAGGGLWVNRHEDILYYSKGKPFTNRDAVSVEREPENVRVYGGETWDTKNPSNVWSFPKLDDDSKKRVSGITQKPAEILERIVAGSCRAGGLAMDFFAGSGSFGAACNKLGVRCVLVDKEPIG